VEIEMRDKTPVSGMGGRGGPVASIKYKQEKESK